MSNLDLGFVDSAIERHGRAPEAVIGILQAIQGHYRYLPPDALRYVCEQTQITPAAITGVATFYTQFRHRPVGEHMISICHGTACHVKGSERIHQALEHNLRIPAGDDTDPDGRFTVQKVACLGCCTLAPVIQIGAATYGRLTPGSVPEALDDFLHRHRNGAAVVRPPRPTDPAAGEIRVGLGSCCVAQGSADVRRAVEEALADCGAAVRVKSVGCVGMCHQTPLVELALPRGDRHHLYAKVDAPRAAAIVRRHFQPQGLLRRIGRAAADWLDRLASDEGDEAPSRYALDVRDGPVCAFLGKQKRIATEHCGELDPLDLDEYVARGGFQALTKAATMPPAEIVATIKTSGLRGRGGAGFPTGDKWATVAATAGPKYLICNGDEGDPGAFMDRMLLESFPYRVIEGMAIAARAVAAEEGIFYIRAEYPLAVERIRQALDRCYERGLLGDNVAGAGQRFAITIKEGAGAFVCGEETALLASIEGRRGMPRLRPPYPAVKGLWDRPTLVNNVETYSLVPWIIAHGGEAFAALGAGRSRGTKVFALAGKVRRGGLIEVPMGVSLREIVEQIGGGVGEGRQFKAVQVGGPSGGCIPAELADTAVDYEALTSAGAIMGSGGLVVLDDTDCMVDIARYFLRFTQEQSCGKCTFCRIGTRRMLDILDRICEGHGKAGDLDDLDALAQAVGGSSLCGLGKTAPNPVRSTLHYFRHEYEAHLAGRCPAGKCKALVTYRVTADCIGCTLCYQHCPADAIELRPYARHQIDMGRCTRCDTCRTVCPTRAVVLE